jgi:hypothetical protein
VSGNVLGDIQGMAGAEAAGEEATSSHRRELGAQDVIQDGLDFLDVYLNPLRHVDRILSQLHPGGLE